MKQENRNIQQEKRIVLWKSLYFRIFLFVLIYSCVFLFLLLFVYKKSYNSFRTESVERAEELTNHVRMNIESTLASVSEDNFPMVRINEAFGTPLRRISARDIGSIERIKLRVDIQNNMAQILNESKNVNWIALMDSQGHFNLLKHPHIAKSDLITIENLRRLYQEEYPYLSAKRGHTYWFRNPMTGNPVLAKAVFDYSIMNFTGYLMAEINPVAFQKVLSGLDENFTRIFSIYGVDGKLFFKNSKNGFDESKTLDEVLELCKDDDEVLAVSYPVNSGEVSILNLLNVEQQSQTYIKPLNDFAMQGIALSIFLFAIGALVMFGSTSQKLKTILVNLSSISSGRFDDFQDVGGEDELSMINLKIEDAGKQMETLIQDLINEKEIQEKKDYELLRARFHELQSQVNPHFLFNSLQAINGVVLVHGDREASKIIGMLAKLLRGSLERKSAACSLKNEIDYVKNYLELCKTIYPDRLNIEWGLDTELNDVEIPTFILQPIVENSVVHGIEKLSACTIKICSETRNGDLILSVYDNGNGIPPEVLLQIQNAQFVSKRIGLNNIQERLRLMYGNDGKLIIDSEYHQFTNVEIVIPLSGHIYKENKSL